MNKVKSLHFIANLWLWSLCQPHSFSQYTFPPTHEHESSISTHPSPVHPFSYSVLLSSASPISPSISAFLAAILDDQSVCGRGERLALALARENINSVMEGPARARVEVDIYELQKDSQYDTTDTSELSRSHRRGPVEQIHTIHQRVIKSS